MDDDGSRWMAGWSQSTANRFTRRRRNSKGWVHLIAYTAVGLALLCRAVPTAVPSALSIIASVEGLQPPRTGEMMDVQRRTAAEQRQEKDAKPTRSGR
jgi:hypothetical protein